MKHLSFLLMASLCLTLAACGNNAGKKAAPVPGTDGNKYVPYDQRTGDEAVVYFTRDLSPEGLKPFVAE